MLLNGILRERLVSKGFRFELMMIWIFSVQRQGAKATFSLWMCLTIPIKIRVNYMFMSGALIYLFSNEMGLIWQWCFMQISWGLWLHQVFVDQRLSKLIIRFSSFHPQKSANPLSIRFSRLLPLYLLQLNESTCSTCSTSNRLIDIGLGLWFIFRVHIRMLSRNTFHFLWFPTRIDLENFHPTFEMSKITITGNPTETNSSDINFIRVNAKLSVERNNREALKANPFLSKGGEREDDFLIF